MKRFISLTITLLCLWVTQVHAYDFSYQNIYYNKLTPTTVAVTYYYSNGGSYSGTVVIPSTVTYNGITYNVTGIETNAFYDCSNLTSVYIGDRVTSIEEYAFDGCSRLRSVTIPASVTSIASYAFRNCSGLTSVSVASGNTVYDSRNDCNAIIETETNTLIVGCKNTVIPSNVTSIGEAAFYNCSGLTSIDLPAGLTSIGSNAFALCSQLASLTIPNSVTSIENDAFYACSGLMSLSLGNSVTSIGSNAFMYCSGLKSLTIPNSVTSIENSAFYGCSGLTSLTIPSSVTIIGNSAFRGCSALKSLTIPSSVTSIESYAFFHCSGLTSLTIPNSVTSIGNQAFNGCSALTSVIVAGETPPTLGTNVYNNISSSCRLFVPTSAAVSNYQSWEQYFGGGIETFVIATGITLNNDQPLQISVGETATLTATVTPADVFDGSVTWTSSDETVATVSSEGVVTAVGEGTATITATTNDGTNLSALCMVTVSGPVLVDGIILSNESLLFTTVGETATLTATVTPSDATNKSVTWSSSDETVATVNSEGVVTAVGEGTATITATTNDGTNLSATCVVTMHNPIFVSDIILSNENLLLTAVGETATLTASVSPSDATNKSVTWSSSDETVATVSSEGIVTAVDNGTATITATTNDGTNLSATCVVTVNLPILVSDITLSDEMLSFPSVGSTATLTATVTPADATDKSVTWTSSDETVATVSSDGIVTAVGEGAATITAATNDGTNLSATCTITVGSDTDISQIANAVYIEPTEGLAGTEQTLSIKMKNSDAIQTVQFDLYLPDGVEVVLDEDDYELIELSLERTTARKMDQFSVARTSNGAYRVLINSSRGNTFDGNDGEIATARVKLADDMAAGDYPLIFRDIVLVNTSSVGYRTPYVKSTWSIADYLPGDVNNDKFVDAIDLNAITNYILEHRTFPFTFNVKAGDINGDNLIDAIDLNAVTNMILHDAQEAQDGAKPRAVMVGIIDNE